MLHKQFNSTKEVLIKVVEANAHCHNCKHEDEYNRHDFTSCNFEMSNFLTIADFTEKFTRINVFLLDLSVARKFWWAENSPITKLWLFLSLCPLCTLCEFLGCNCLVTLKQQKQTRRIINFQRTRE